MSIFALSISAFIIGLSGAMMPGPLLTYVINGSLRRGFIAGPLIILGHALLELILIILLLLGLNRLFANKNFAYLIGIIGGSVLLWMGYGMIKSVLKKEISLKKQTESGGKISGFILPGAVVSISNPYWILWWSTVGMTYLVNSYKYGALGTGFFYFGHVMADFVWYSIVSWVVVFGRKLVNDKIYRGLIFIFGIILIYFAGTFITDGLGYFFF